MCVVCPSRGKGKLEGGGALENPAEEGPPSSTQEGFSPKAACLIYPPIRQVVVNCF